MDNTHLLYKPFDLETHKQNFIDYLEVVILEDGTVEYAVPSHQEKLIAVACQKLNVTRDELSDMCPEEYYFDFSNWLCKMSGCVAVYTNGFMGKPNDKQFREIMRFVEEGVMVPGGK